MLKEDIYAYLIKVSAITKIGLLYSTDPYAIENYKEIEDLTTNVLQKFQDISFERNNFFAKDIYPTPSVSVRAVIRDQEGRCLFVKEASDNTYSLPGGWCDLYDSPQEAIIKEIFQESGIKANVIKLIGIIDKKQYKHLSSLPIFDIVFEAEIIEDGFDISHEVNEIKFEYADKICPLSNKNTKEELARIITACETNKTIFD